MTTASNSRVLWIISLLTTIFSLSLPVFAKYSGGTGEPNDPYQITTAEDLMLLGESPEDYDKHFKLIADIDLSVYKGSTFNIIGTLGSRNTPAKPFTGVFDGNEHVISNFTYTAEGDSYIGFFRHINGPNAEIRNLGLIDPNITGKECSYVGSLVGFLGSGTITNCYVKDGIISGDNEIGGLVGINSGTITHCSVKDCTVSGDREIGGLVGQSSNGTVTDCCCTGTVGGNNSIGGLIGSNTNQGTVMNSSCTIIVIGSESVGGLVGYNGYGIIKDCYSDSRVDGVSAVGGLVGHNDDRIINSYSSANVIGQQDVGGLVGQNTPPPIMDPITNCYSTGTVDGEVNVGGLVGFNLYPERVTRSFWDVQVSGQEHSAGGEGKVTAQMQTAVTFLAWAASDNEGIWTIDEGNDYPRLCWEGTQGTTIELARLAGTGTEDDPYLIYTVHELSSIGLLSSEWDKHFKLMADIDLSIHTGTTFSLIEHFSGIFDGSGHSISNFTYGPPSEYQHMEDVGLFGRLEGTGNPEIKNLGLIDPHVDAGMSSCVAALVGYLGYGTTITNCYVEGGKVSGSHYVGGLAGWNEVGTVMRCYARSSVEGLEFVGGLVGLNNAIPGLGVIMECYSTGNVNGNGFTGGLVGTGSFVLGCFWDIETSGQQTSDGGIGLTTIEMQTADTFLETGWDFVDETANGTDDIWWIDEGNDYPRLWWERMVWFSDYMPLDSNEYGVKTLEWVYGQTGEYTSRIGETETVPYLSGPITGVQIIENNNTLVGTNDGLNVSFLASGEWILSTDPNLAAHPPAWTFSGLYDDMIINQGVWYLVKKDLSEWQAVDNQQLLIDIQDITVPEGYHNKAVIFWYLDTAYSFAPLDFHGNESDLGITLPSSSQTAGYSVTGFDIFAVNTGVIAQGDINADTGSLNDLAVLKQIE